MQRYLNLNLKHDYVKDDIKIFSKKQNIFANSLLPLFRALLCNTQFKQISVSFVKECLYLFLYYE